MGEVDDNLLLQRTLLKLTSMSTHSKQASCMHQLEVCLWCVTAGIHPVMQMHRQWHADLISHAVVLCLQD